MNTRKVTSLTALLSFILLILTSVILYIVPAGRVAYWSDWHLWGLTKTQWGQIHINLGVLFLIAICFHIYFNWNPILLYLKNKAKQLTIFTKDFNIALVITLVFILGTFFMVPPFSTILNISENIKDEAALKYGEPPYGHAELSSFTSFVKKTGLDLEASLAALEKKGIRIESSDQTVLDIAKANNLTPKQVFEAINIEKPAATSGIPEIPPPGTGNLTLVQLCEKFKQDPDKIAATLQNKGMTVSKEMKIRDIAEKNNLNPIQLYELIRAAVTGSAPLTHRP